MLRGPACVLGTQACLLCGLPLSHLQRARNDRFCGEACRASYTSLPAHEVCVACGRRLSPREFGDRLCASPDCRRLVAERKQEQERLRLEVLQKRAEELRDFEGRMLGLQEPETYTPTVLPASRARITKLPEERLHAFREFVKRLVGVAGSPAFSPSRSETVPRPVPGSPDAPTPEVQAVLNGACALCGGFCCGNGGDHAYFTVETLRRYMAKYPDQGPDEVLAAYLGHVRSDTVEGSCIFHQPGGCGLPREMRSDTCNRFFCKGLTEFQQGLTGRDAVRVFLVATQGEAILAAAFCDADGTRLVPIGPTVDQDSTEGQPPS
jgi:hypothetical protein